MKLLLTSAGLMNKSISQALLDLIGKPASETKVAFIPTAANVESGDKGWLIKDLVYIQNIKFAQLDIVDISALTKDVWLPRLEEANVWVFSGGNTFHLMYWIQKSGLQDLLPELLQTKVWMGISAGSCVAGSTVYNSVQNLIGERNEHDQKLGLGLVNFQFVPHLNSTWFPKIRKEYLEVAAKEMTEPIYALDDQSAIKMVDDKIEIVSEGQYLKFNE